MTGEIPAPPTWRERPISDEEVQRLADEAEAGYDPARLRRVVREPDPSRTGQMARRPAPTTGQADADAS